MRYTSFSLPNGCNSNSPFLQFQEKQHTCGSAGKHDGTAADLGRSPWLRIGEEGKQRKRAGIGGSQGSESSVKHRPKHPPTADPKAGSNLEVGG
jgi:hypothetical protein